MGPKASAHRCGQERLFCILIWLRFKGGQNSGSCRKGRRLNKFWSSYVRQYFVQIGLWGQTTQLTILQHEEGKLGQSVSGLVLGKQRGIHWSYLSHMNCGSLQKAILNPKG